MARNASYIASKYEYANGCVYNPNNYAIFKIEADGRRLGVGGAKIAKSGKVLAFAGQIGGASATFEKCIKWADSYVWGDNLRDALEKIKPFLD